MMRVVALLFLTAWLAGCATAPSVSIEDAGAKVAPDSGLVAVQVVSNSEQLTPMLSNWTAIFLVEERAGAEPLYLESLQSRTLGTDVFVGAVSPGRYRVIVLQSFRNTGDFTYRLRAVVPSFVGTFNVQTGRLTNLGTLIAQPLETIQTEDGPSRRYVVTRSDKPAEFVDYIRQRLPHRAALLTSTEELRWNPDEHDALRGALLGSIREHALPRAAISVGEPGELLSFGRLGQLYLRDRNGRWSRRSLPGDDEIHSGTRLSDGSIALGGERGVVYLSRAPFESFGQSRLPDTAGAIVEITEAEPGRLVALVLGHGDLRIFSADARGANWELEHSAKRERPGFLFSVSYPFVLRGDDGALEVLMDGNSHRRVAGQKQWEVGKGIEFTRLVRQLNGIMLGVPYDAWSGEDPPQISVDDGRTWKPTLIRTGLLEPARGTPYVFSDLRILAPGPPVQLSFFSGAKINETVALQLSADNGRTFTAHGSVPMSCDRLQGSISNDELIFALCGDGRMLASTDRGATFTAEFDPTITSSDIEAVLAPFRQKLEAARPTAAGEGR